MKRLRLKRLRLDNGDLTQAQMAERLGVNRRVYCAIEKGDSNGSPEFWVRLKERFCLTAEEAWNIEHENRKDE